MAPSSIIRSAYPEHLKSVSTRGICVAGLKITIYGLDELDESCESVACLWLLHPRLCDQSYMEPIASSAIGKWNEYLKSAKDLKEARGLIAVSFDQRNHGSREVDKSANLDWKSGNETHAQDMFAGYHGTAMDASHLLTYIPSYLFPDSQHTIANNFVCGVSLGGHAAWLSLMSDPRITAAIVIVGCPDYVTLISERAHDSDRSTAGPAFLGSKDFPEHLLEAVQSYDPAGQLIGIDSKRWEKFNRDPISDERATITPVMYRAFRNKRILNLAGADDRLVPYTCAEPFLAWLKRASAPGGFFEGGNLHIEDIVYDDVGHWLSPDMAQKLDAFLVETLKRASGVFDEKPNL